MTLPCIPCDLIIFAFVLSVFVFFGVLNHRRPSQYIVVISRILKKKILSFASILGNRIFSDIPDPNSIKNPMVLMWSTQCPEGKFVPLRQPAPPVYFQNKTA